MRQLILQICAELGHKSRSIILVTSGAITCGAQALGITPASIPEKQAAASVGQILLMHEYSTFFSQKGYKIGQILLTKDCIEDEIRRKNTQNTIFTLLENGIIPIINENDSVSTDEIGTKFGDNDELSAGVAELVGAKSLILLTDIDGLYTANPKKDPSATLIPLLSKIDDATFNLVNDIDNGRSRGGMTSKLTFAKQASEAGISVVLANGKRPDVVKDIFEGKAVGTRVEAAG